MTEPWAEGPAPNPTPPGTPPGLPPKEKRQGVGPWILAGVICTAAVVAVVIAVMVIVQGDDSQAASDSQKGAGSSSQVSSSASGESSAPPTSQAGPNTSTDAPQGPTATAAPPTNKSTPAPTTKEQQPQETTPLSLTDACVGAGTAQHTKVSRDPAVDTASDEDVLVMTSLLYYAGYMDVASYQYTATIEQYVFNFQSDNGLVVDGMVGPQTWTALQNVTCN